MGKRGCILFLTFIVLALGSACSKEEVDEREDFIGTWDTFESFVLGQVQTIKYSFDITRSARDTRTVILTDFCKEYGTIVESMISGKNFSIPPQTIKFGGEEVNISGSGILKGQKLTYTYEMKFTYYTRTVNGTATKSIY